MKSPARLLFLISLVILTVLNSCDTGTNPGDDPAADVRDQFTGNWNCSEASGPNYPVTISKDPSNSSQVLIYNFHLLGQTEKVFAIATSSTLSIPTQSVSGNTVNGNGTLVNANRITMKYYVNNQTDIDTVNANYNR